MPAARLPLVSPEPAWQTARATGLIATVVLLAGLVLRPEASLHVLWDQVIPMLPALFALNPLLWRNVCPLATLNDLGGARSDRPVLGAASQPAAWAAGMVLLALLVPARHFALNANGALLASVVAAVAVLAVVGGFTRSRRAGFCNAFCPVLPVEKLYGQAPVLRIGSSRCADCNRCASACLDLAGAKAAVQSARSGERARWYRTPFGLFACAFPGFILGYFRAADGPLSSAPAVYGSIAAWTLGSLAVAVLLVRLFRVRDVRALLLLGAASLATYYWFAAPRLVVAYGGPAGASEAARTVALAAIAAWGVRGWRRLA